jgi:hypothetical protein
MGAGSNKAAEISRPDMKKKRLQSPESATRSVSWQTVHGQVESGTAVRRTPAQ